MFRSIALLTLLSFASTSLAFGQNSNMKSASCRFGDGTGLVVRYSPGNGGADEVPYGTVWTPGGTPFVLLTETPLKIGKTDLPIGGYRIYLRPEKDGWSLIVNDGVTVSGYDAQHDLARVGMQSGALSKKKSQFKLSIVRTNPNTCSLTLFHGKSGYWVDFAQGSKNAYLSKK